MTLSHRERAERRRLMALAVQSGESVHEVARRHRVSAQCVRLASAEQGIAVRGRRVPIYAPAGALRIYAAISRAGPGDSLATVGERLGVTKQRVWQVLQEGWRLGLPTGRWEPPAEAPAGPPEGKVLQ
jgi:hypothetical protein